MKEMYLRYKEVINYLFFGVLGVIINISIFYIFDSVLSIHHMVSNLVAFIVAVLFAYVTNKLFVFDSKNFSKEHLKKEMKSFLGLRLVSGGFDMLFLYLLIDVIYMPNLPSKIVTTFVSVVINYCFSKFIVFKR